MRNLVMVAGILALSFFGLAAAAPKSASSGSQCPHMNAKAGGGCPMNDVGIKNHSAHATKVRPDGCCASPRTAAPRSAAKTARAAGAHEITSAVCPVMGSRIPDTKKAAGKSVYRGKTYYFCCDGCKPQFDRNPSRYVKPAK